MSNTKKIISGVIIAVVVVTGLLFYYQSQGLIKIFPTKEERELQKILKIEEEKFLKPDGLTQEQFETKRNELYETQEILKKDSTNKQAWFDFGKLKSFFNDHEGAALAWEVAFQLSPDFLTAKNLGFTYQYFLKDYPVAESYYKAALEFQPDLTAAHQELLDLYRFNWKEKSKEFEPTALNAIEKDKPNALTYYVSLVEFYVSDEYYNIEKANQYFSTVKEMSPEAAKELKKTYPQLY